MINLNDYFDPVSIDGPHFEHLTGPAIFPHNIFVHTESSRIGDLKKFRMAIIGVPEGRNSPNSGSAKGPDAIRKQLYQLSKIPGRPGIIDLGNMKKGISFRDTIAGLSDILSFLLHEKIFPVILGGSSALVPAFDRALSKLTEGYTLAAVDPRIDYSNERKEPDSYNYLNTIMGNGKSRFRHYINIGYQTYLNDQQVINRFIKRRSELNRIGDVRQTISLTEPLLRDSDAVVFDICSVRQSDAPGTYSPSPNGFYGEEICLLARYAGISDNIKVFGLFEVNPELDIRNQTSGLAAQIIWLFLEGFAQKQNESPALASGNSGRFVRHYVRLTGLNDDLVFLKSNLTDRWWMEVPSGSLKPSFIACSYDDYLRAGRNELPDRWVKAMEREKP